MDQAVFGITRRLPSDPKEVNFAHTLAMVDELMNWPPARFRVALRRARESDLGYGDVTLIGIPSNGALLPYNLAYHTLPEKRELL